MLKKILLILFIFSSMSAGQTEKQYQLAICALFKNEAPHLKEWIEYHHTSGVDHFYLYNLGSQDTYRDVLSPYIEKGVVTLVNWPEVKSSDSALITQIPAYENAINLLAKEESKWLVFMNIEEFLFFPNSESAEVLKKYENYPAISFDLSNDTMDIKKMIFKPDLCQGFTWPPYQCCFKDGYSSVEVGEQEVQIKRFKKTTGFKILSYEQPPEKNQESMYSCIPAFFKKLYELKQEN